MGCASSKNTFTAVVTASNDFHNDEKWEEMANWGKDLGLATWGKDVVRMSSIHTRLFMGSRLSAQEVIDNGTLKDQDNKHYRASRFHLVCVASDSTCKYCTMSSKYKKYDIKDTNHEDTQFIKTAIKTAKCINNILKWGGYVLVHCHSGRNRSALAVLVYCAKYTNLTYENALYQIRILNSSRFPMQSTLQNTSFTSAVRNNWQNIRDNKI